MGPNNCGNIKFCLCLGAMLGPFLSNLHFTRHPDSNIQCTSHHIWGPNNCEGIKIGLCLWPCSARKWVSFIMSKDFKDIYYRCKTFLYVTTVRLKIVFDLLYISNIFLPQNYFRKIKLVNFSFLLWWCQIVLFCRYGVK